MTYQGPPVGRRIGDTIFLDSKSTGPLRASAEATIALRGIIGVGRVGETYVVVLEGGSRVALSSWEAAFVQHEWEGWERERLTTRTPSK